jgi:hypothetical protein
MALGLVESGMDVVAVDRNATALAILGSGGHKAGAPIAWPGIARMPIEPT